MEEVVGYIGTLLVILSYLSKDIKNLRILSITACIVFIVYGVMKEDYPILITNLAIIVINLIKVLKIK